MLYVSNEELRRKIMESFRDFLQHQAEHYPNNKNIRDFLNDIEE